MTPTPKVAAAGVAGAVSIIIVWLLNLAGVDVPAEVASALTAVLAFAAGWFKSAPEPVVAPVFQTGPPNTSAATGGVTWTEPPTYRFTEHAPSSPAKKPAAKKKAAPAKSAAKKAKP